MPRRSSSSTGRILFCCVVLAATLSSGRSLADGERLWAALKEGGKVILLRHTHVDIRDGMGRLAPGNCADEVNLSPRGMEQARRIGKAFRARGIAVGEVLSSPYCRCMDTGRLAFGHATAVRYLLPPGAVSESEAASNDKQVLAAIQGHRGASNLVLISHQVNIANVVLESAQMGEFFVLRPTGSDFTVIGKVSRYAQ